MSRKIRLLLMGLAVVVVAVLVWFLVLSPIRGKISDTESSIEQERTMLASAQTKLDQAEATRTEGRRNQARLLELAKMVPSSDELPSLLLQLQDLADQAGIEFITITPGQPLKSETGDYQMLPLELGFTGTYFDVGDFIYRAEQMVAGPGRLLAIKAVDLSLEGEASPDEITGPNLTVDMSVYAFIMGGGTTGTTSAVTPSSTETNTSGDSSTNGTTAEQ